MNQHLKDDNLPFAKSVQFESLNRATASDILDNQIHCKRTGCGSIDVKRMNCFLGSFVCLSSYSTLIVSKFNKSTDVHILSAPYFHKTVHYFQVYILLIMLTCHIQLSSLTEPLSSCLGNH